MLVHSSVLNPIPILLLASTVLGVPLLHKRQTADQWRQKSIYQVVTDRFAVGDGSTPSCDTSARQYCGGNWAGIESKLDYIAGMGFDAVWISPIVHNIEGDTGSGYAYHGYWQDNPYELNQHFGSASNLNNLASALHSRNMSLMVDIVVNHFGSAANESGVSYSSYPAPFNQPPPTSFHDFCTIDYNNQTSVEQCWLSGSSASLPDVNTENNDIIKAWYAWIPQLVANYSIDGLRIDTIKHVRQSFWSGFQSAAGVFATGEVFDGDPAYVGPYQNYLDSTLNYPLYYPLYRAFSGQGSFSDLASEISSIKSNFKDPTVLGNFVDNQDNPRFGSYTTDSSLNENVISYVLLGDGIPIVYYGFEQGFTGNGDPNNREPMWNTFNTGSTLYKYIARVNSIRALAGRVVSTFYTGQENVLGTSSSFFAFAKGPLVVVLTNAGSSSGSQSYSVSNSSFASGTQITDLIDCGTTTVGNGGSFTSSTSSGRARVWIASSEASSICSS